MVVGGRLARLGPYLLDGVQLRNSVRIFGGAAIVLTSFFGTLFVLDYLEPAALRNRTRAEHARKIMDVMANYKNRNGGYPVATGFLDDIKGVGTFPQDPAGRRYSYASDGKRYGILISLEETIHTPAILCTAGDGIRGTGAWGDPPECQF
jgi:hypothetical protein